MLGYFNRNEIISWGLPVSYNLTPDEKNPQEYRCHINGPKVTILDINVYFEENGELFVLINQDDFGKNKKTLLGKFNACINSY